MTEPGDGDITPKQGKRPTSAALFVLSALIVILLVIGADQRSASKTDQKNSAETAAAQASAALLPAPAPLEDPGPEAIRAWKQAAAGQAIDIALYDVLYVQDAQTITAILTQKGDAPGAVYEITLDRASGRVTALNKVR